MGLILVLDEDRNALAAVRRAFEDCRHQVLTAADGEHGVKLVRAHPPHLVLLLADVRQVEPPSVEPLLRPLLGRTQVSIILVASYLAYLALSEALETADLTMKVPSEVSPQQEGLGYAILREVPTSRELEVADLAAQGLTNAEIGARLHISAHTVKTHISRILAKLGCRRRVDLSRRLHRPGA